MTKPIVFMFSGQGSQYYKMGKELYDENGRFRLWMNYCDEIVRPMLKTSLIDVIYHSREKHEPFDNILYSNPGLLSIEYSLTRLLMEMDIKPDYLLGYSLGEFTAAVVSGAISLEDGLRFVVEYARILERKSSPAGMLAVIESIDIMNRLPDIFRCCWVTGRNFQNNFVVSGLLEDIMILQKELSGRNIVTQRLPVNYGFHTQLMESVKAEFMELASKMSFSSISIPIVSALKAYPVEFIDEEYLWEVTRYPVEFKKTVSFMIQNGDYVFIDSGPSGSLATHIKYLLPPRSESTYIETINQFGRDVKSIENFRANISNLACPS